MEGKIAEICEIEVGLYLDYYNGEYKFSEFNQKLDSNQKKIINLVYDLLEDGYDEKEILSAVKKQGEFYKESPEWFGEDDDSSNYPSEYFETNKSKKYPFHEKCGYTLSLVKRFFKTRKAIKAEHAYQKSKYNNLDDGMREMIYTHMKAMKKKKNKSKGKRSRRSKRKNKKNKSKR
tara:strand:- start:489 stop:1016 length:528 start_codon:yes stop_codon:yes gene_type:complete